MNYKYQVKCFTKNALENFYMAFLRKCEKNKFKDSRRKRIYTKVQLSVEQKQEIDDFYLKNYGRKIPYTWHKHFTAFTGKFDYKYFPELLYIPEFEFFMNYNHAYTKCYGDKNLLPIIAKSVKVQTPDMLFSCTYGILRDNDGNILRLYDAEYLLKNAGLVFLKPTVDSCSGNGCRLLNMKNGVDLLTQESCKKIISELGLNYVVQRNIKCHSSITRLYPNSVNTFRVITYRWKNEFRNLPSIMRIGQGGKYLDNAHAGGMFIAIDDNGVLHQTAFTEFKSEFQEHPDTRIKFSGYKIDNFRDVISAALTMHSSMPQLGVINWDFTIDEKGKPVLIEANCSGGSIWLIEMAHGKGAFGEYTSEILQWIQQMKKGNQIYRNQHLFGY